MSGRLVGPDHSLTPWHHPVQPEPGGSMAALVSRPPGVGTDIVLYKYTHLQGSSTGSAVNAAQHLGWVVLSLQQLLKRTVSNIYLGFSEAGVLFRGDAVLGTHVVKCVLLRLDYKSVTSLKLTRVYLELVTLETADVCLVAPGKSCCLSGRMEKRLDRGSRRTELATLVTHTSTKLQYLQQEPQGKKCCGRLQQS